jgi:hypothetical protein
VRQRTVAIDALIAAVVAVLWIVIAPGLAIVAISAFAVLLACAISLAVDGRPRRRGR